MIPSVDVFIMGAGPAGLCAALRLQQLGYRVALIERSPRWPRPQIGEALTPGVKNIIDFLDANQALEKVPHLARLPTRLCWQSHTPEIVAHSNSAVVNRAAFDAALLRLARERGVQVYQPASLSSVSGQAGAWQLNFATPAGQQQIQACFILDARGRSAQHIACAPRLSASWAELAHADIPVGLAHLTQVEAVEHGWLWGTHLPDKRYRVMLLCDPATQHQLMPGRPEVWLRANCASSQLFAAIAGLPFVGRLQACSATPYLAYDSWQEGCLKLGDAAFALDPISSSGVEKAMRFSLQAVIAIHTVHHTQQASHHELAREFFQRRLIETCARHSLWTQRYYAQVWCSHHAFWRERAVPYPDTLKLTADASTHALFDALQQEFSHLQNYRQPELKRQPCLREHQAIRFSRDVKVIKAPCVMNDRVQLWPALQHPHLESPLAFLENEALLPRLAILWHQPTLAAVLGLLSQSMSIHKARRLLEWLWQRGLLEATH
ncbi:NAD(P)/FAD-dependent oxidoreductase [Nitrosomonas sp. Nm34]|uniref:flavin-dependent monooxygenase QhpG n=1 Tax=Nitrosomonas sp. Nm34 TaxID=1881055 RepID=UPI0008E9D104|nr:tryptophan 7-halogenase [Nitrosomonas sp. Nm34]SFI33587.1 Dehydrogenase (flavoprotein) [Nitrosomonas sp. Nm34]